MASELSNMECVPCKGGAAPLKGEEIEKLHRKIDTDWNIIEEHHLEKSFSFLDFRQALDFTNKVGELAESQGHHPDIYLSWGKVKLTIWTHKIDGLTESDFIFAAKVDHME